MIFAEMTCCIRNRDKINALEMIAKQKGQKGNIYAIQPHIGAYCC